MLTAATIAIAVFAALIAFGQGWTARQKLVLDLFEKRFQVFLDIRNIASEATQTGKINQRGFINEIVARSQFLFGDDINASLKALHLLVGELEVGRPDAAGKIFDHFEAMLPLFHRYLGMHQRLPKLPWQ